MECPTKEKILEAAKESPDIKRALKKLFPMAFDSPRNGDCYTYYCGQWKNLQGKWCIVGSGGPRLAHIGMVIQYKPDHMLFVDLESACILHEFHPDTESFPYELTQRGFSLHGPMTFLKALSTIYTNCNPYGGFYER